MKLFNVFMLVMVILNLMIAPLGVAYSEEETKVVKDIKDNDNNRVDGWAKISRVERISVYSKMDADERAFEADKKNNERTINERLKHNNPYLYVILALLVAVSSFYFYSFTDQKKGQLTLFIIMGFVIMTAFTFVYYVSRNEAMAKLETTTDDILSGIFQIAPINQYVTECLEKSSKEALKLVGEQGGVIYRNQTGNGLYRTGNMTRLYTEFVVPFSDDVYNVSYGITQRDSNSNLVFIDPPRYPYYEEGGNNFLNYSQNSPLGHEEDTGSFAYYHHLNYLCYKHGANAYNLAQRLNVSIEEVNQTCWYSYTDNDISIQFLMQDYITQEMEKCIDFSPLSDLLGHDIARGNVTAEVLFGEDDVTVLLEYPLMIALHGSEPITRFLRFQIDKEVRMKKIYFTAKRLREEEINNPFFSIGNDWDTSKCRVRSWGSEPDMDFANCTYDSMGVTKHEKVCEDNYELCSLGNRFEQHHNYTDVVVITDNESLVDGKPYVFQFAVENRIPALDWIHTAPVGNPFDIITIQNMRIAVNPFGFDPDEDLYDGSVTDISGIDYPAEYMNTTYFYSGWRENYTSTFDFPGCDDDPDCAENPWAYTTVGPITNPGNWTNSSDYQRTNRNASIGVDKNDTGAHIVNVSVCDDEGLCDWQEVRILVLDRPKAKANLLNQYDDVDDSSASVEDMYILDSSESSVYIGNIDAMTWSDDVEGLLYEGNSDRVFLPTTDQSIDTIRPLNFSYDNLDGNPTEHSITLTVTVPYGLSRSDSTRSTRYVYQCLAHNRTDSAPYPYNSWLGDDDYGGGVYSNDTEDNYQADHVCCVPSGNQGGGSYADASTECYYFEQFTCYPYPDVDEYAPASFTKTEIEDGILGDVSPASRTAEGEDHDSSMNDIYKRVFSQNCSGNRGNACSGAYSDVWEVNVSCDDKNGMNGEDESCFGPCDPSDAGCDVDNCPTHSIENPSCHAFGPGESFEKDFLGTGDDGICNPTPRCSTIGADGYGENGPLLCSATCGGTDGCNNVRWQDCVCSADRCRAECYTGERQANDADDTCHLCGFPSCEFDDLIVGCDDYDILNPGLAITGSELNIDSCQEECNGIDCCDIQEVECGEQWECPGWSPHDAILRASGNLRIRDDEASNSNLECYKPNQGDWRWGTPEDYDCDDAGYAHGDGFDNDCDGQIDEDYRRMECQQF